MRDKTRELLTISLDATMLIILLICGFFYWDLSTWFDKNSWILNLCSILFPAGALHVFNQYILAPSVYYLAIFVWHNMGHYGYYKSRYGAIISKGIDWLVSCKVHWGVEDQAEVEQNANTCEGLMAMRISGQHKEKSEIYKQAFITIISNATPEGLPSKSLQHPTVVCTSMLLDLVAKEREDPTGISIDYDKYEKMANNLWNARSQRSGWGVYITKSKENECSLANTYWALRALSQYKVGKTKEFCEYLKLIYQRGSKSTFGFQPGDNPRLVTTAMYLNLYYGLDSTLQNMLNTTYNPKSALEFVYNSFVTHNIQIENETLHGMKVGKVPGPIKAPWKHITVGYALDVLLTAAHNKSLNLLKRNLLFIRINKLIKANVKEDGIGYCYYLPQNMEHCNTGIFTYPTAYLVQGLSQINTF